MPSVGIDLLVTEAVVHKVIGKHDKYCGENYLDLSLVHPSLL